MASSSTGTTDCTPIPPPPPQQQQRSVGRYLDVEGILRVSRVVWEMVVAPGWLDVPTDDDLWCAASLDVIGLAQAMFPLVPRACHRVMAGPTDPDGDDPGSTYGIITIAARALAPSCIAWISNHRQIGTITNIRSSSSSTSSESDNSNNSNNNNLVVGSTSTGNVPRLVAARALLGDRDHHDVTGAGIEMDHAPYSADASCVGGTLPLLWDGRCVARWRAAADYCVVSGAENDARLCAEGGGGGGTEVVSLRQKVVEYSRASCGRKAFSVCDTDNVEFAHWLVSVLGIEMDDAPWMFYQPIWCALYRADTQVVKWLFERFQLGERLDPLVLVDLFEWCVRGISPGTFRWFVEKKFPMPLRTGVLVPTLLRNESASVEDCQWFESAILSVGVDDELLMQMQNPEVVKWVLTKVPLNPSEEALNVLCGNLGDVEFTQWLITEKKFTVTPQMFEFGCACTTSKGGGLALAKWLSTRVTLSQSDVTRSLLKALQVRKIEVAEWLENTFHVMNDVISQPGGAEIALTELCTGFNTSDTAGLRWFLQHLPHPLQLHVSGTHNAISEAVSFNLWEWVAVLVDTFPESVPRHQLSTILTGLMRHDLGALQRFITKSVGEGSPLLTPEFMGPCLTSDVQPVPSSRTVKW
ncbi:hypothetical protein Pelo_18678 [Pelomyxa schiedti]|nr:hypothetical protein Pelo_18678 [Pelomyxa schiedti]